MAQDLLGDVRAVFFGDHGLRDFRQDRVQCRLMEHDRYGPFAFAEVDVEAKEAIFVEAGGTNLRGCVAAILAAKQHFNRSVFSEQDTLKMLVGDRRVLFDAQVADGQAQELFAGVSQVI
jgi:hypothetical protein